MSTNSDILASGEDWSVSYNKESNKLVCSFNNEEADDDLTVSNGMVRYCLECDRYFDVRSGCEKDIRADERNKLKDVGLKV